MTQGLIRADSTPSYMKIATPKANSEIDLFNSFGNPPDQSPRGFKIGEGVKQEEPYDDFNFGDRLPPLETPKTVFMPDLPNLSPTPTRNLAKRRHTPGDKIETPSIKLKGAKLSENIGASCFKIKTEEVPDPTPTTPSNHKQLMVRLLEKTLQHQRIDALDLQGFNSNDLELVRSIVKRKYSVNISQHDFVDKKRLADILNSLDENQKTEKRSEENNKLIFKRAIKYMIADYKEKHANELKEVRKNEYEAKICKYYFGNEPLPESKKSSISNNKERKERSVKVEEMDASKPRETTGQEIADFVINPNTINAKYIRFVFSSALFKAFFDDFVDHKFMKDYAKSRTNKLLKIVDTIYDYTKHKKVKQFQVQAAQTYIERNAKFKLPWTDKELEKCKTSMKEFIKRVYKNKEKEAARKLTATRSHSKK